ncbi:MAG: 3'(2'),5'-bisphosphate nucleotidase CysQ [Desulfobacteraceae bacterium]|nr:3'(2'),5'-bisphosphate nucleotidase CysQ [Desulfobacteraceae bacterium]
MPDFDFLAKVAREAGRAILEVYGTDFSVESKEDKTPLTQADTRSHRIISDALRTRYPDIPIVSEEGREIPVEVRTGWNRFWLVDPLDGTKEFVKRNGEFTVNIALVEDRMPLLGLIYIPVQDRLFLADVREGCWEEGREGRRRLRVSEVPEHNPVRIVRSRSHPARGLEELLPLIPSYEIIHRGCALKFCAIAAGEADFYPRFGPTCEWDTAAGQAIVTAAGGTMLNLRGGPFLYNKKELVNGPFLAASSRDWLEKSGVLRRTTELMRICAQECTKERF